MASGVGVGSGVHGISGPGVGQVTDGGVVGVGVGVTSSCSSDPSTYLTEPGTARITAETGYSVAFKSSNTKVATVGKSKGLVTAVGVGSAKVTATFTDLETGEKIVKTPFLS